MRNRSDKKLKLNVTDRSLNYHGFYTYPAFYDIRFKGRTKNFNYHSINLLAFTSQVFI